ncbi:MAG: magnesium transporter [Alphaproteobacteria bacterium]|jgi:magnesium transporter|nr:magnesium transporter [Alphaproteobacteria bacterium]
MTHTELTERTEALGTDDLRSIVQSAHPADAAAALDDLEPREVRDLLTELDLPRRAVVFGYLRPELQVALARLFERRQLAELITEMDADDRADVFNKLSPDQQSALLPGLAHAERENIRRLAGYAEGTAGAIMTSDYATLSPGLSAQAAIDVLRREALDKETIYRAYVLDDDRRLIGVVRLSDLILAPADTPVEELMDRNPVTVALSDHQEDVAQTIARYDILAVPVIDEAGRLVGIVTHDDALDALQEEATEDFHKLGTVARLPGSVRDASIATLYQKRVFWLALLVFGNLFSGAGIAYFEDTISAHVALVFFLPLLIGSSGNAGAQAATLMVRALATGDVRMRDWGRLLGREVVVALALGATMALAVSLIGIFRGGPEVALVVACTMVLVVIVGSLIGMSLPFLLHWFNRDPATASAPLVTTIADAVGVVIYFAIATAILF